MLNKIIFVTKYANLLTRIVKNFKVSEQNPSTGIRVWNTVKDFVLENPKIGNTNSYMTDSKGNYLKTLEFDISKEKLMRADVSKGEQVTLKEIIEAIKECVPHRISDGSIKIVVDKDNKEEVKEILSLGLITKNNNLVSTDVLKKLETSIRKSVSDLVDIDDKDISGMDDIENVLSKASKNKKESESKKLNEALEDGESK